MLDELEASNITPAQMRVAEVWILKGNWEFRGARPVLNFSDFFPNEEQVTLAARAANMIVMSLDERARMCRKEYDRGFTDGTVKTREEFADTDERRQKLAAEVLRMTQNMAQIKAESEAVRTRCARLQAELDGDNDPEKRERIVKLYQELQRDFRKLGEEYWALKSNADQFHNTANEFMGRLLNSKSPAHAYSIIEEYRELYKAGEELMDIGQADIDSGAYRMRVFDRAEREYPEKARQFGTGSWEGKKRRHAVEQKIDKHFPRLVIVPAAE